MLTLVEDYSAAGFAVYEHHSGAGVIITNAKSGPNARPYNNVARAQEAALALLWGGKLSLTHRFKKPEAN